MNKTLLYGLIPFMLVRGASALDKKDLAKLETLVKNDANAEKGYVILNGVRSDAYRIALNGIKFEFSRFGVEISYADDKNVKTAIYDLNKDGKFDGGSWRDNSRGKKSHYFEVSDIFRGDLKDIKFELSFSKDISRAREKISVVLSKDFIYGVHPDNSIVKADFLTGELKKEKNDNLKRDLQGCYNTFIEGLRNHYYKPKKDSSYKKK